MSIVTPMGVKWVSKALMASYSWLNAAAAKSLQSCPTLCDPIDGSPPGSPILGIFQARILEWGAIVDLKMCNILILTLSPLSCGN